jgi:hypothetical protein
MTLSGIDSLDEIRFAEVAANKGKKPEAALPKKEVKGKPKLSAELPVDFDFSKEAALAPGKKGRQESQKTATLPPPAATKETDIYSDVPVSFKIGCTNPELVDFLYRMRVSQFVFVVDDLDIEAPKSVSGEGSASRQQIKAALSIRAIVIN